VQNKSGENNIPEIWETEEDKLLSTSNLKHKYFAIARNKFNRIPPIVILNKDKNWLIELSRRVISEWRIKSRTRERIISIISLDTMIEGAKYIKTVNCSKSILRLKSKKRQIVGLLITILQHKYKQKNNHIRWVKCADLLRVRRLDEYGYRQPPTYNIAQFTLIVK